MFRFLHFILPIPCLLLPLSAQYLCWWVSFTNADRIKGADSDFPHVTSNALLPVFNHAIRWQYRNDCLQMNHSHNRRSLVDLTKCSEFWPLKWGQQSGCSNLPVTAVRKSPAIKALPTLSFQIRTIGPLFKTHSILQPSSHRVHLVFIEKYRAVAV